MKNSINFDYIGTFKNFDVIIDNTNNVINFFDYDKKENATYCLQWNKKLITNEKVTINKCKEFWFKLMITNLDLKKNEYLLPFEQRFESGFYEDIIKPIKEGKKSNLIVTIKED